MFQSRWVRLAVPAVVSIVGMNAFAADYKVDATHSKVGFAVKHMMISKVRGTFKDFEGTFTFDSEKGTVGATNFVVKAASVNTDDPKRDEHLRSPDFFDAEKFPNLTVTNSKVTKKGKNKFKWNGDLTIHGVTKPVVFDLEYLGSTKDPWGNMRAGFTASATIKRKDFGMTWNKNLDTGGVVVGEDVEIQLDVEGVEQAAAPATAQTESKSEAKGAAQPAAAQPSKKK